ncbi:MarR family winged helix-turn-helix transcriptional regulator [Mycolicibacterium sp. 22603]|uniref:MarR family winged helix-turn-helix transcriptional regulator n=1 Tax=Mycolicibacterium sp. 22603 TaxID=3453950 RepID=UPI003F831073
MPEHRYVRGNSEQLAAWRALYRADALLSARLDAQLRAALGITFYMREVLDVLHRNNGRLRMGLLAAEVVMSQGGMTRLITRMEGRGLVRREPGTVDGRTTWAVLTDTGGQMMVRAQTIVESVVSGFFDRHVTDTDLRCCASALTALDRANSIGSRRSV